MQSNKSKDLSIYDFYQILQLEWIVADLRVKIYPQIKNKKFWQRVKDGKKQKIESIAEKNHLPTIFTDEEMKRAFEDKIYGQSGFPNFLYKDEEMKRAQHPFDLLYYYAKGSQVRFEVFDKMEVGIIVKYSPHSDKVTVLYSEDKEIALPLESITRIL